MHDFDVEGVGLAAIALGGIGGHQGPQILLVVGLDKEA